MQRRYEKSIDFFLTFSSLFCTRKLFLLFHTSQLYFFGYRIKAHDTIVALNGLRQNLEIL
jgi:hypothetical protein